MHKLADQQEIMGALADMIIECYAMDCALVRALKIAAQPETGRRR